jgi:putative acetyltransferase
VEHRAITREDIEVIHRIYMDEGVNPYFDYEPMPRDEFRPIFDALVAGGDTVLVVDEGRVVGTYRLQLQSHRCAHVATLGALAVHPDARGRGYGGRLLDDAVARARARGARRVELLVEADNPRAIRLYERHGFVKEGVLRGAFRRRNDAADVDEIAMGLLLVEA